MVKIRIYIILLFVVVLVFNSCSKEPEINNEQSHTFIKFFGGRGMDYATDIIKYNSGFALTGTLLTSDSAMQAFLIVVDSLGNELPWSPVLFGGISNDIGNKIFRLQSGDFIVTGTKVISENSSDSCNIMVARISTSGVIKWLKYFGGNKKDEGYFGMETSSNDIIFGGYTESFGNGGKDICLYKINSDGDLLWEPVRTFGALFDDKGVDIIQMNNRLFILGTTQSFNIYKKKEIFVVEADLINGKPLNMNHIGVENGSLEGLKFSANSGNDLLISGQFNNDNSNLTNAFLLQLNLNLTQIVWRKFIPANENEYISGIFYQQDQILLYCNNVSSTNSNIKKYILDNNGEILNSRYFTNSGKYNCKAVLTTSDSKTCIVGSSVYGNNSKILLLKGNF